MWIAALIILLAIIYGASPYDVLPDFILGWGWIDDLLVIWGLWRLFNYLKQRQIEKQSSRQYGNQEAHNEKSDERETHTASPNAAPPPHAVLGVSPDASLDEIKQAYRQLANQYHPDKVSHLGQEFQELAEKRFKEIQDAYQTLRART